MNSLPLQKLDKSRVHHRRIHITPVRYYIEQEELLLRQIGFVLTGKALEDSKYITESIDNDDTRIAVTVKYYAFVSEDE